MVQAKSVAGVIFAVAVLLPGLATELNAQEVNDASELDRQFSTGLEALENDELTTARKTFINILNVSPSLHRARVELARAYYLSMDYGKARAETQQVLDDPNTPPNVRTTLLAFLAQIDEDERQFQDRNRWTPSIYLGGMYDSNVNIGPDRDVIEIESSGVGPDSDVVNIGGTALVLAEESRKRDDYAGVINAGIAHTYNPGKTFSLAEHSGFFLWQSQLNGYYRHYIDEDAFHLGVATFRTGPSWVVPRHWRASIGLQVDKIWLGSDGLALFYTLNPTVTWQFGDSWELTLDGVATQREYDDEEDADRDGLYGAGSARLDWFPGDDKDWTLQAGAGYADFDAEGDRFSYTAPDAFLGIIWQAWNRGSLYARAAWRGYEYDGVEPIFGEPRDDDEYRYTLGFQHDFQNEWQLLGNWTHTDNESNLDLFEYDRDQVSLGVARSF